MPGTDPDLDIWKRAQQGDENAYRQLRHKYRPLVRGEIRKRLHTLTEDDLLDIEQDVWLGVWNSLARFRGRSLFSTWLAAIAKNHAYEWLRRKKSEETAIACVVYDSRPERAAGTEDEAILHLAVHEAAQKLGEAEREVNHLRYFLQLTDEEVAQTLSLPPGTVKSRLRAGLKKLRTALEGGEREEESG